MIANERYVDKVTTCFVFTQQVVHLHAKKNADSGKLFWFCNFVYRGR